MSNIKHFSIVGDGAAIQTGDAYMVFTIPPGNYTGVSLASATQSALQAKWAPLSVVYNPARGILTASAGYNFRLLSDGLALTSQAVGYIFLINNCVSLQEGNLISINDVIRHSVAISAEVEYMTFGTQFWDLLTTHNIYLHSLDLGHYICIGVRGENAIIKKYLLVVLLVI